MAQGVLANSRYLPGRPALGSASKCPARALRNFHRVCPLLRVRTCSRMQVKSLEGVTRVYHARSLFGTRVPAPCESSVSSIWS